MELGETERNVTNTVISTNSGDITNSAVIYDQDADITDEFPSPTNVWTSPRNAKQILDSQQLASVDLNSEKEQKYSIDFEIDETMEIPARPSPQPYESALQIKVTPVDAKTIQKSQNSHVSDLSRISLKDQIQEKLTVKRVMKDKIKKIHSDIEELESELQSLSLVGCHVFSTHFIILYD